MMTSGNNRIAKNTLMLYIRQILILIVSLYTIRVLLEVLGVEDYGIYNVVGGIVSFFSFLSGTMASATQRFFSFALGQNDYKKLNRIFSVNLIIYGVIAIIVLVLIETLGLWFVKEELKVLPERIESVKLIFHFSVLAFTATILTTPFIAIIIAHEDMHIFAYLSIVEAIMKLGIVFLLIYMPWDKLELYGVLVFGVSVINLVLYILLCVRKYIECQFRKLLWDKNLFKEIVNFTGWTLFGQVTTVGRNQAITILLNQMFNPIIVAARAIAMSVADQINVFSNNFNLGLYPPIIKSYAQKDMNSMFTLIFNGSKITFFLMWVFALPIFLEMDAILHLWLKNPPIEAVLFTRLALIEVLINSISLPIITAARAPGRMKTYELVLGTIQITIFIVSWGLLKGGCEAYYVYIVAIIANIIMFIVRLLIVRNLINLPIKLFISQVFVPIFKVIFFSVLPSLVIHSFSPKGLIFIVLSLIFSIIITTISMYFVGLNKIWRKKIQFIVIVRVRQIFNF